MFRQLNVSISQKKINKNLSGTKLVEIYPKNKQKSISVIVKYFIHSYMLKIYLREQVSSSSFDLRASTKQL